jgi:DMSO reductase anchor subunit
MSVGSWILSAYGGPAGLAAVTAVTGKFTGIGKVATVAAGLVGPAVAAYTGVLIADTAVPTWHEGYRELPFVFVGSAACAASGLGMIGAPVDQASPARKAALLGATLDVMATKRMERTMGMVAEPLHTGTPGKLMRAAEILTVSGALVGGVLGRRSKVAAVLGGAALLAGSACTRFGIFHAGVESAKDPKYTVVPQRERLRKAADAEQAAQGS